MLSAALLAMIFALFGAIITNWLGLGAGPGIIVGILLGLGLGVAMFQETFRNLRHGDAIERAQKQDDASEQVRDGSDRGQVRNSNANAGSAHTIRRGSLLLLIAALAAGTLWWCTVRPTADSVMRDFYAANDRAEDMLMDPLILNADLVAPVVIAEVRNPQMPLRRYAIGFLGNERIATAVPTLLDILQDEAEPDVIRANALEAIYRIEQSQGLTLAERHAGRDDHFGYVARGLLDGSHVPFHRTWLQARLGHHE